MCLGSTHLAGAALNVPENTYNGLVPISPYITPMLWYARNSNCVPLNTCLTLTSPGCRRPSSLLLPVSSVLVRLKEGRR